MEAYKIYFKTLTENRENKSLKWMILEDYVRFDTRSERNKILSKFLDELERKFPNGNFAKIWIKTETDYEEFIFLFTDVDVQELHGFEKIYTFDYYNHKRPEIIELRIEHLCTVNDNSETLSNSPYCAATLYRSGPNSKTLFSNKKYWVSKAHSYI